MNLTISFNLNNFSSTEEVFLFTVNHLHFAPRAIYAQLSYKEGYHEYDFNQALNILSLNNDTTFRIADDLYSDFEETNSVFYRKDQVKNLQYLIFRFESLNIHWQHHLLKDAHKIGFFMAFYEDQFKALWQNEIFINHYTQTGKAFDHLNLKMHWHPILSPIFNEEVIDIFHNPGHSIMTYNTWLMAAPEMWFGNNAWQYFEKQNLKAYSKATAIDEIEPNLVYIKLFDADIEDYENKDILNLQADFREYSKMNKVEMELQAILNEKHKEGGTDGVAIQTIIVE